MSDAKVELDFPEPILEDPPANQIANATLLADDDALTIATVKAVIGDTFLKLLVRDLSFSDFLRDVLMAMVEAVRSDAGSILEVDYDSGCLHFRAVMGRTSDRLESFTIPIGQGIVGHVVEAKQASIVNNVERSDLHLRSIDGVVGFGARNIIALPLIVRGRVFGVVELLNRVGEDGYTQRDLDLLTYACELASRSIEVRLMIGWAMAAKRERRSA